MFYLVFSKVVRFVIFDNLCYSFADKRSCG